MGSVPIGGFKDYRGFNSYAGAAASSSSSLVLNGESGMMVVAPSRTGKKGGGGAPDARAAMALKSHKEAEKRRRERINAHLATLRSMLPCPDKLDKAALLAEVISHVKELKSRATEISKSCTIPSDVDEVRVEVDGCGMNNGCFLIKATLSCEDRPELYADLRQTLCALQLRTVGAEISALGGRVKNVLVMSCEGKPDDFEQHLFTTSVHQALKAVLDRDAEPDFLPRNAFSNKRHKTSLFESSCSSS